MALKNYEHGCSTLQALASLGKIEGVVPLLHGPQPCLYQNQVGSMSCRPAQLLTAGTLINKSDVIFGGEENLKQQVRNIYAKYKPACIVIINTCVPQLIGEDVEGIIIELKEEMPDLTVVTLKTGFNYPRSMPRGSDAAWAALIDGFEPRDRVDGMVGIIGRTGQDAGNMAPVDMLLKKAGLKTALFPAPHIDEMRAIVTAEALYPIHITPHLTCKRLKARFGIDSTFIEIPVGLEGTSNFLRGVADRQQCQKLHDVVDEEERRVRPEFERIKAEFARRPTRMLLVTGPANEVSIGKIMAEFGAEVFIVPCMKNPLYKQEKALMQQRYNATFIEEDFETLRDVISEVRPDVVACEFQAQVETAQTFLPTIINMMYLCEYGYDYAVDLGTHFFKNLRQPVYQQWQRYLAQYGG
jgi:nitrogenase molybdenum-iron protein alpha chain